MDEFLRLMNEFGTSVFDVKIFCGIIAAILVFIMEIRFMQSHKKKNRRKEKAIQMGHVVRAKRTQAWDDDTSGYSVDSWYHAAYVYKVDGRTYKYRYLSKVFPPVTLSLYYINNPRRVFTGEEKKSTILSVLFYILPVSVLISFHCVTSVMNWMRFLQLQRKN